MTTPVVARVAPNLVVFDGQSLNLIGGYPSKLMTDRTKCAWLNVAIGGTSWTVLQTTITARVLIHANACPNTIVIMVGGTADITQEGDAGATIYSDMVAYSAALKAAGFNYVIGTTITKTAGMSGAENTHRTDANTLILADASGGFNSVVDLAGDSRLADPTDTTYYVDGIHWTSAGAQVAADLIAPALTAITG